MALQFPQLPKPEEITNALVSFPPKLSVLTKSLSLPEEMFESSIRSVTGVEPPPGPARMIASFMESFEAGAPALPSLPGLPTPTVPSAPPAPSTQTKTQASKPTGKIDVEVF